MPRRAGPGRVVLVGAPNVGKSMLFNRLLGRERALVHPQPGVTRDRIAAVMTIGDREVELLDTGGVLPEPGEDLGRWIAAQSLRGVEEADVVVLVADGRSGLTAAESILADHIRRSGKPAIIAVNKLDHEKRTDLAAEFHALGFRPVLAVSAAHGLGINDLREAITNLLPRRGPSTARADRRISFAFVGRPNVGKSSLLNRLLDDERVLVTPEPGTTRDPVDTLMRAHGIEFRIVDTAGIRRRKGARGTPEALAMGMAADALARAQVVVLVLDATAGVTTGDQMIARLALDAGRAVIPVINKWDLLQGSSTDLEGARRRSSSLLGFVPHHGVLTVSAATGLRVRRILTEVQATHAQFTSWSRTSNLNRALREAVAERSPPLRSGRSPRLFYAVQTSSEPPAVDIHASAPTLLPESYLRYLVRRLGVGMGLDRTPLRLTLRSRRPTPAAT